MQLEAYLSSRNLELSAAPPGLLGDFVSWLVRERKQQPATVELSFIGAETYVSWRRGQGEALPPISSDVALPRKEVLLRLALRGMQVSEYLAALDEAHVPEPVLTALRLAPFCGLRLRELSRLKVDDIVRGDTEGRNDWWRVIVRRGKGGKFRQVPLPPQAEIALRPYLEGDYFRMTPQPDKALWPDPHAASGRLGHQKIQRWLRKVRPFMGGKKVNAHALRRTYCTMLVRDYHVPIETVSRWMGHKSIATTLTYYVQVDDEELVRDMDRHFGPRSD